MLEVESGSNDPCAYMLTIIILSMMNGDMTGAQIVYIVFAQIVYGTILGVLIATASLYFLQRFKFTSAVFDAAFLLAIAILAYAAPAAVGGNGYLRANIVGIFLGNNRIKNKKAPMHFFDGITGLMQMLIFFPFGIAGIPISNALYFASRTDYCSFLALCCLTNCCVCDIEVIRLQD